VKKLPYKIEQSSKFKRQLKILRKRAYKMELLEDVVTALSEGKTLEPKYRDHALHGEYVGYRECHITPDWLLIYKIKASVLVLVLHRTGTHSDLF
jgi:mRNA interferase YafQ